MKKGFTLIELLVVIIILGALASLIIGNFFTSLKKGRDAKRKADLEQIKTALEMYYEDKRAYPTQSLNQQGFVFGGEFADGSKSYMKKVPNDPLPGKNYRYETDSGGNYYKMYACLENNQQILPYTSSPTNFSCETICKDNNNNSVSCIWGISSSNTSP